MSSRKPKKVGGQTIALDLPVDMVAEMMNEAERLERSVSWMVQWAWRLSKTDVAKLRETS